MIVSFSGNNSFALRQALKRRVQEFIRLHGDFGIERYDASQTTSTSLIEGVQAMPFLAGKRLVIIQDPADNKQFIESFPNSIAMIADDTEIIFVQSKFDKRSSFYKFLQKHAENYVFDELSESELLRWIQDYAKLKKGSIQSRDAQYLIERIGTSQTKLQSELDKLFSYTDAITKETIDLLTVRSVQSSIFDLIEALFAGKPAKALAMYKEQRMQKVEPLQIVAMIVWQLHILALVKTGSGQSSDTIAREAKINPYVVRKTSILAQNISMQHIKSLVERTRDLERRLKRESVDADEALLELLVHFNKA